MNSVVNNFHFELLNFDNSLLKTIRGAQGANKIMQIFTLTGNVR